ncbi:shikimate kinase [Streptomyces exfoliatus]|uniref:aldose epimerase family protein n=1 Tax=Streptomyces exfoliatus TaxID=1905 RepID=UPI000A62BF7A|nr:shikimate kinase [Streptomyces exfoliatus]
MVIETAAGEPLRMALVVGVAGSGKSTVGRLLAERLGWEYQDADAFHSEAGRARMPLGRGSVDGTPYDFRTARPLGDLRLDTAFTGLDRTADGRATVRLAHPSGRHGVDLWLGEGTRYVQVFTGDTLAGPERRRGVAVEPMSCPPDAFRSGTDLTVLEPGATHVLRWGLSPWGDA